MPETETQLDEASLWSLFADMHRRRRPGKLPEGMVPFDFTRPHRFTPSQRKHLHDYAETSIRYLSKAIAGAFRSKFQAHLEEVTGVYLRRVDPEPSYYVAVAVDGEVRGFWRFPRPTALQMVTKMLGGVDDATFEMNRTISALESDLLLDLCERMTEAMDKASKENNGPALGMFRKVHHDMPELFTDESIVECTQIKFQRQRGETLDLPFSMMLLSDVVEPIADYRRAPTISPERARQEMLEHVNEVSMPVKVELDLAHIPLRDIACLQPGDVILMRKQVGQPVDLSISGKVVMNGRPVQHKGLDALQINELTA